MNPYDPPETPPTKQRPKGEDNGIFVLFAVVWPIVVAILILVA